MVVGVRAEEEVQLASSLPALVLVVVVVVVVPESVSR
jgi:hypothetical protein